MTDINNYIEKLIEKLQSPKSSARYDACEYLRVAPAITPEAIKALQNALNDPDKIVAEAAKRALDVQLAPEPSSDVPLMQGQPTPGLPGSPAAARAGSRFSLVILGIASMASVQFLLVLFFIFQPSSTFRLDYLPFFFAYPLFIGGGYFLFGFAYLVPFHVALMLPAKMNLTLARRRVVLSGLVAGLVYCVGYLLSSWLWG